MKKRIPPPGVPPMPTWGPPRVAVVQSKYDLIPRDEDVDWTLDPDWDKESMMREVRNRYVKEALLEGRTVSFRSSGWSLFPRVHSGDRCYYEPVNHDDIEVGDIVFCEIPRSGRFHAHIVHNIELWNGRRTFLIGNNNHERQPPKAPHYNGYCNDEHVYGKMTSVFERDGGT